jgi:hypothetical protein
LYPLALQSAKSYSEPIFENSQSITAGANEFGNPSLKQSHFCSSGRFLATPSPMRLLAEIRLDRAILVVFNAWHQLSIVMALLGG